MRQIKEDIKNGSFNHIYLLTGDEAYLRRSAKSALQKAIAPDDMMNTTVYKTTLPDDREIIDTAETLPLFSDKRLLVFDGTGVLKGSHPALAEYISNLPEHVYMIFSEEDTDAKTSVFKAVKENGYIATCNRMDEKQLINWCATKLSNAGKKIRMRDMEYFISCVGNDMFTLSGELEKLIGYTGDKDFIEKSDIDEITYVKIDNHVFDMVRLISARRRREALSLYAELVALREKPRFILSRLIAQYNTLLTTYLLHKEGNQASTIAKEMKIPLFAARKNLRLIENVSESDIIASLEKCAAAEEAFKSGKSQEQLSVELLIIDLTKRD